MAYVPSSRAGFSFAAPVRTLIGSLRDTVAERLAYRRTHADLTRLTDRELADIGLERCDIERVCIGELRR